MTNHSELVIELALLEEELEAEEALDPLDLIPEDSDCPQGHEQQQEQLDQALIDLAGDHEQQLQGLKFFCEHRDPRALPLLMPLLKSSCPILRMSAVYALGRNPNPEALPILLPQLQQESNGFVRKALAWTLGNYADPLVVSALLQALSTDIAAVRLWAASSLVDCNLNNEEQRTEVARQLLLSLRIDTEPAVRSNSAWGLGRLIADSELQLAKELQEEMKEALVQACLHDSDSGVRDDALNAVEQLNNPTLMARLQSGWA
ncbi:MAG: HEAT repeat domain-containing protein [Synechococcus sp. SupBloom_Metag_053]|nr:HEAT repeat domain-containing protein [Synechococcus sp. SupBloom_Metag_053]